MKKIVFLGILFCLIYALGSIEYVPNQIIVKSDNLIDKTNGQILPGKFARFINQKNLSKINILKNSYYLLEIGENLTIDEIQNLNTREFPNIEIIQPNYLSKMLLTPNDPEYIEQEYYYNLVKVGESWQYETGSKNILVAIIDSGLHFDHPDLQTNIFINSQEIPDDGIDNDSNGFIDDWRGWDFVDAPGLYDIAMGDFTEPDNQPEDELNHGTHLAGIIAADTNNNEGVAGINWTSNLLIIRAGFLTEDGQGYLENDDAAASIIYAADMGAQVINLSWGDEYYSPIIADACQYARDKGSIIVASSGNTYGPEMMYPAGLSTTISVGAINKYEERADFSSYGPGLDLVAPGVNVLSTYSNTENFYYSNQSGTSVASPFVTAAVALLLATDPTLNFDQVKSYLAESCKDLGATGYDNEYGYGLLDINSLINISDTPILSISSPIDMDGFSEGFPIIGTVNASNFSRYSVCYTTEEEPEVTDWYDVNYPHDNSPQFYFHPVIDGTIAEFDITGLDLERDIYALRIELIDNEGYHYSKVINLVIDQTEPVYIDSLSGFSVRYSAEIPELFLHIAADEPIDVQVEWPQGGELFAGNQISDIHNINFHRYLNTGPLHVTITNQCGLMTEIDLNTHLDINNYDYISTTAYLQQEVGEEIIWAGKGYDIDNNGYSEFFGLTDPADNQQCNIFEFDGESLNTKTEFSFSLWPLDIGNTDGSGIEIIGLDLDNLYLYDSYGSMYPNYVMWIEPNVFGGNFTDYDDDPYMEVALIKNKNIDFTTKRVISLFNREGLDFYEEFTLINNTETFSRNEFSNRICSDDFDQDGRREILATDKDGDVIIYEYSPEDDNFINTWVYRLPVKNSYYLDKGDFDGDGNIDFCVGGYQQDYAEENNNYSYFSFFRWSGEDNKYIEINSLCFSELEQKNAITVLNIDEDINDEVILALSPNLYLIDYNNSKMVPVWNGTSSLNYQNTITGVSQNETEDGYVLVNTVIANETVSSIIQKHQELTIEPPSQFSVNPINENSVQLNWNHVDGAESYLIYRKLNNNIELIDQTENNYFSDINLTVGDTIYYRISSVEQNTQQESYPTVWKETIPYYVPELQSIIMVNLHSLHLIYSERLSNNATEHSHFNINNNIGFPASVIFTDNQKGLLLNFNQQFVNGIDYCITIDGLEGATGIPVQDSLYSLEYVSDTESPYVTNVEINNNKQSALFIFSELMNENMLSNSSNYDLILPAVDPDNRIEGISIVSSTSFSIIEIVFNKPLEPSIAGYYLTMTNLKDLSGNEINIDDRICHFNLTDIDNLDYLIVYPNPLDCSNIANKEDYSFRFLNLPRERKGKIYIYDVNGDIIFRDTFGPYHNALNYYRWNIKNSNSRRISSGMYFYMIEVDGKIKKGKLAIIN